MTHLEPKFTGRQRYRVNGEIRKWWVDAKPEWGLIVPSKRKESQ